MPIPQLGSTDASQAERQAGISLLLSPKSSSVTPCLVRTVPFQSDPHLVLLENSFLLFLQGCVRLPLSVTWHASPRPVPSPQLTEKCEVIVPPTRCHQ